MRHCATCRVLKLSAQRHDAGEPKSHGSKKGANNFFRGNETSDFSKAVLIHHVSWNLVILRKWNPVNKSWGGFGCGNFRDTVFQERNYFLSRERRLSENFFQSRFNPSRQLESGHSAQVEPGEQILGWVRFREFFSAGTSFQDRIFVPDHEGGPIFTERPLPG